MSTRMTQYGVKEVVISTILLWFFALGCGGMSFLVAISGGTTEIIIAWGLRCVAILLVVVWVWVLAFFRDPYRETPEGDGLFISPADGVVSDITNIGPDSPLGRGGVKIGIFMSIFNVHVNRIPCEGTVEKIDYKRGSFLDVRLSEAWLRNESATIRIKHEQNGIPYPIVVRQVAGLLARVIVTDLEIGWKVKRGSRFGMIKFGSRLELMVPDALAEEIKVSVGQKVLAGETILISSHPAK